MNKRDPEHWKRIAYILRVDRAELQGKADRLTREIGALQEENATLRRDLDRALGAHTEQPSARRGGSN